MRSPEERLELLEGELISMRQLLEKQRHVCGALWDSLAEIADPPTVPLRSAEAWREWAQRIARAAIAAFPRGS